MTRLFSEVLRISLEAALVALAVMVLRELLVKRLHPGVMRMLWLAPAVRAALPGHLPVRPVPGGTPGTGAAMSPPNVLPAHQMQLRTEMWDPARLAAWVWAAGAAALALILLFLYLRMSERLRFAVPADPPLEGVFVSESVSSPLVWGIRRPRIILPPGCISDPALDLILCHERIHIRRMDYLLKPLALLAIHWFNPVLWAAFFLWSRDTELACDEAAAGKNTAAYAEALLSAAARQNGLLGFGFAGGGPGVRRRIRALLLRRKPLRTAAACAVLVTAGMLFCAFTGTPDAGGKPRQNPAGLAADSSKEAQGTLAGEGMAMPLSGKVRVLSPYGERFGGEDFHTGIDLSLEQDIYGAPVLAAADGTVRLAQTSETPGYGYGKYVILDHGGGIGTLYAHCSDLLAETGETVKQGQQIARAGSTGFVTEPHLHFEVTLNGVNADPVPWISGTGRDARLEDLQKSREAGNGAAVRIDTAAEKILEAWSYPGEGAAAENWLKKAVREAVQAELETGGKSQAGDYSYFSSSDTTDSGSTAV